MGDGGRQGGKCYIALLTNCCPYLGTLWANATVLKREQRRTEEDNDSVRPNAHPMFQPAKWTGQIILLTTSQKSGYNTQQVTSNLSEANTDFRSIPYSRLRKAQGSISYKLKTHTLTRTTMFYLKPLLCFHLEHEWLLMLKAKYICSAQTPVYWMESTDANQNKGGKKRTGLNETD